MQNLGYILLPLLQVDSRTSSVSLMIQSSPVDCIGMELRPDMTQHHHQRESLQNLRKYRKPATLHMFYVPNSKSGSPAGEALGLPRLRTLPDSRCD